MKILRFNSYVSTAGLKDVNEWNDLGPAIFGRWPEPDDDVDTGPAQSMICNLLGYPARQADDKLYVAVDWATRTAWARELLDTSQIELICCGVEAPYPFSG